MDKPIDSWTKLRDEARTLRDEIRLKLHLGGMDAKEAFQKLDKQADQLAGRAETELHVVWDEMVVQLKKLRSELVAATNP